MNYNTREKPAQGGELKTIFGCDIIRGCIWIALMNKENSRMRQAILMYALFIIPSLGLFSDEPKSIEATSRLTDTRNILKYAEYNMIDGNPITAWVEGRKDAGIGEHVIISFNRTRSVDTIKIMPGYFSGPWHKKNNRVKKIVFLFDDYQTYTAEFRDEMTEQTVRLPQPYKTDFVRMSISDIYPGSEFNDTCIAEISLYYNGTKILLSVSSLDNYHQIKKAEQMTWDVSPAGLLFYTAPDFNSASKFYFFPDGTFVHGQGFRYAGATTIGKWRLIENNTRVEAYDLLTTYLKGKGDTISRASIYYEDFDVIRESRDNMYFEWPLLYQKGFLTWDNFRMRSISAADEQEKTLPSGKIAHEIRRRVDLYTQNKSGKPIGK